ncbi:MAG: hypothetical protein ACK5PZ_14815 [Pirellula sp.]|jgi:hypothetical protein
MSIRAAGVGSRQDAWDGAVDVELADGRWEAYSKPFFGIWQVLSGFHGEGEEVLRLQKVGLA